MEFTLNTFKYSHTSFYELPLYETSELRNRFLEVTASTKNQQILQFIKQLKYYINYNRCAIFSAVLSHCQQALSEKSVVGSIQSF